MARALPGALVSAVKGRVGGTLFRTRGSTMVISRTYRPAPRLSVSATTLRALMPAIQASWDLGTGGEKTQWDAWARRFTWPDAFGHAKYLTGRQAYFWWAFTVYDILDRQVWPSTFIATPTGVGTTPPCSILIPTFSISAGPGYDLWASITPAPTLIEVLYAARGCRGNAGSQRNWQYIGAQQRAAATLDWYSYFTASRVSWDLQLGEPFYLRAFHFQLGCIFPNAHVITNGVVAA